MSTVINTQVVAHSVSPQGKQIASLLLTYPRIIHAELLTHRVFSRNAASSRAIPARKMIEAIEKDPFIPIAWQREHSGMQGTDYIKDPAEIAFEVADWLDDRDYAIKKAKGRVDRKITKQLINRPLEPFQWYTCLVTSTEWDNFFDLRSPQFASYENNSIVHYRSKDDIVEAYKEFPQVAQALRERTHIEWLESDKGMAEIHLKALAETMWTALKGSTPRQLQEGQWHIPFGDDIDEAKLFDIVTAQGGEYTDLTQAKIKIATARCARTSYTLLGDVNTKHDYLADMKLHDKLAISKHASPFEHCALVPTSSLERSRNFNGWVQYRDFARL